MVVCNRTPGNQTCGGRHSPPKFGSFAGRIAPLLRPPPKPSLIRDAYTFKFLSRICSDHGKRKTPALIRSAAQSGGTSSQRPLGRFEHVEFATLERVRLFNSPRLLEPISTGGCEISSRQALRSAIKHSSAQGDNNRRFYLTENRK